MRTKAVVPCLLVGVSMLVAAGCGGTSRNKAYAGSKTAYVAALNSICTSVNQQIKALHLGTPADIAARGQQARDIVSKAADKIASFEPPAEVKTSADSFVAGLKKGNDKLGELIDALKSNDQTKARALVGELSSIDAATSEDARFVGADQCARTSG